MFLKVCLHYKARRKLQNDHHNNLQRGCKQYRKNNHDIALHWFQLAVAHMVSPYRAVRDDNQSIRDQLHHSNLKLSKEILLVLLDSLIEILILHSCLDIGALPFAIVLLFKMVSDLSGIARYLNQSSMDCLNPIDWPQVMFTKPFPDAIE